MHCIQQRSRNMGGHAGTASRSPAAQRGAMLALPRQQPAGHPTVAPGTHMGSCMAVPRMGSCAQATLGNRHSLARIWCACWVAWLLPRPQLTRDLRVKLRLLTSCLQRVRAQGRGRCRGRQGCRRERRGSRRQLLLAAGAALEPRGLHRGGGAATQDVSMGTPSITLTSLPSAPLASGRAAQGMMSLTVLPLPRPPSPHL